MKSKFLLDLISLEINNFTYQVPKNYEEWLYIDTKHGILVNLQKVTGKMTVDL